MHPSSNEASDMGHVCQQVRTDFVRDRAEGSKVNRAWIGRISTNDQLGLVLQSQLANGLHIKALRLLINAVLDHVEPLATHIDR